MANNSQTHSGYGDNVKGDKIYVHQYKNRLRNLIDRVFLYRKHFSCTRLEENAPIEKKIELNEIPPRWKNKIFEVASYLEGIKKCCDDNATSSYTSTELIELFSLDYIEDFQEDYKSDRITAEGVLDGIAHYYVKKFEKSGCDEAHDRHTLPLLVSFAFIECGVLEKNDFRK